MKKINNDGFWMGELEVFTIAHLYDVIVVVFKLNNNLDLNIFKIIDDKMIIINYY